MHRILPLLLVAGLAGCASSPAVPDKSATSPLILCDGKPKPAPKQEKKEKKKAEKAAKQAAHSASPQAAPKPAPQAGRLEVKAIAPAEGEQQKDGERRLSLVAESIPLRELAPRLSEVLGTNIVLAPALAGRRVWLWMPDVTVRGLQRALLDEYEIASTLTKGVLFLEPKSKANRSAPAALEARVVELSASAEPAQVARLWCRMFATRRGSAAVLDGTIVFEDTAEGLSYAEALVARFGGSLKPLLPAAIPASPPAAGK